MHPCADALSRKKALIHYAGDFCKNDALQFCLPASAAPPICAAKGEVFLPCERCFCRAYCTGVPAQICICGQCGGVDRQSAASCPARPAQAKKYAGKTSSLLSVPNDLIFPHSFSRRKLRAFGIPFLKICASCEAGAGLSSQSLHFWGLILMRLGLAGGFDLFCALESSATQSSFGICQPSMSVCSRWCERSDRGLPRYSA